MWKISLLLAPAALASIAGDNSAVAQSADFKLCESTYALCTTAACTPVAGKDDTVSCVCDVKTDYSAGQETCQSAKETSEGKQVRSRYYPVKSYAVCSNDRSWAWCLDKPCIISKNNPEAAACTCDAVRNLGDYVIVTSAYAPATCTTGVISSATVQQITQVTDYLKTKSKVLTPFPIKVLNDHK